MRRLSGAQAMSDSARDALAAVILRAGVLVSMVVARMAELPDSAPFLSRSSSTQATFLPSGETAACAKRLAVLRAWMACSIAGETFSFSTALRRFSTACLEACFSCAAAKDEYRRIAAREK